MRIVLDYDVKKQVKMKNFTMLCFYLVLYSLLLRNT